MNWSPRSCWVLLTLLTRAVEAITLLLAVSVFEAAAKPVTVPAVNTTWPKVLAVTLSAVVLALYRY